MKNSPENSDGAESIASISDLDRPHAVIRFLRDVDLPRFPMRAGERWSFVVYRKYATMLEQIKRGERFKFAGGQVLAQDVEIIYEGDCGLEYSIASGHVTDAAYIAKERAKLALSIAPVTQL